MRRVGELSGLLVLAAGAAAAASMGAAATPGLDTATIERMAGFRGQFDAKTGVFKISVPRADLDVRVGRVHVTPAMGLTSWAAFERMGGRAMVMGDLVLLEGQVNPVMDAALANGLEVTALHNHFFWESPRVMFMHIGAMGDEATLAAAVGKVFATMGRTSGERADPPEADIDPARSTLDPKPIEATLGHAGDFKDGVLKVVIGRSAQMGGQTVGAAMGVATWAAFAGSNEKAVVDGDFAMRESELQGVLKSLRHAGIDIVAIHQHMTGEHPRTLFLHYWGIGPATDLARGLRSAIDTTTTIAPAER